MFSWQIKFKSIAKSFWRAYERWSRLDCVDLSAAFAYYTLQSFFPILLISLSVASWFLGRQKGLDQKILDYASQLLPPSVLDLVNSTLVKLVEQGFGAGILGAMFLMVTAGNAYLTLQRGADRLWEDVLPQPRVPASLKIQAFKFLRSRLEAFLAVLLIGSLIVLDQISANLRMIPGVVLEDIKETSPWLGNFISNLPVTEVGQLIIPLLGFSIMALLLQALLPSRRVPLLPLIPGSILIGSLLTILNLTVSRSLFSLSSRFQAYGLIGGVLILTLWVWTIGVIIYYGQCWSVELANIAIYKNKNRQSISLDCL